LFSLLTIFNFLNSFNVSFFLTCIKTRIHNKNSFINRFFLRISCNNMKTWRFNFIWCLTLTNGVFNRWKKIHLCCQYGIPTTRHGKLVTATIRHILEINNSENSSHIINLLQDNLPHRHSLQYLSKNGHFNNDLSHLCASKQEFRWFLVNSTSTSIIYVLFLYF